MSVMGKYIYGIVNSNLTLNILVPKNFLEGETDGGKGVWTISYQDISAVVSDSEIVDYTHMSKDALARFLVRHQKVIEGIMDLGCATIPVRLGTFATNESEVKDILNKGYKIIKEIMKKIKDKIEIDVVATWSDFNSILKEVGEEKEIKEFKEKLLDNPKEITMDDQMKVGAMVKTGLDKRREDYAFLLRIPLNTISEDFKAHELMDDKMVANFAFLIDKTKQEDFDRKVEELNIKFQDALNFRCVGPLPPYSFWTLEIKNIRFEEIDWARKKLNLSNDFTNKEEIKKAYRRLAFSSHPDKNIDILGKNEEFDEINKAHKILIEYCLAIEQTGQREGFYFNEEEYKKNSILVKVRE